jgi:hypothetical protein
VFEQLSVDAHNEYTMMDSTIVRAHQHAARAKGGTGQQRASAGLKADCPPRFLPPVRRSASRLAFI